ncbi:MAG: uroporphyrinogen decarboxylase family protein [Candidatus Methanoplasma sp.]|nr:uroporphyrinogen decarboxylase family protein [Candidatus Methanoplasma sp.]
MRIALDHEKNYRTPVNNFALVTAARSAGITVDAARWHPKISAKVSIDYSLKTHSDFVKPVLDSQVPYADLGMDVIFPEDDYGYIKKPLVKDTEGVDGLAFFDPNIAKECPNFTTVIVNGLEETSRQLTEDLHVCGLSWGPFTTAGYLMGAEEMLMCTFMDPDLVVKLVNKTAGFVLDMQKKMLDAGATVIWIADPTSSGDMISPEMYRQFSFGPTKAVITGSKRQDVPAFLHICGNTLGILPTIHETGADCFSFDHAVSITEAKRTAGKKVALMGNIDPVRGILDGTPEAITEECFRMIETAGSEGGYIIAPGCETPQSSPDENVIAMGRSGRDYWKK